MIDKLQQPLQVVSSSVPTSNLKSALTRICSAAQAMQGPRKVGALNCHRADAIVREMPCCSAQHRKLGRSTSQNLKADFSGANTEAVATH
eukprot:1092440-Amphidinium_carterae.1